MVWQGGGRVREGRVALNVKWYTEASHTSHVTCHTSHVTCHTSHATRQNASLRNLVCSIVQNASQSMAVAIVLGHLVAEAGLLTCDV